MAILPTIDPARGTQRNGAPNYWPDMSQAVYTNPAKVSASGLKIRELTEKGYILSECTSLRDTKNCIILIAIAFLIICFYLTNLWHTNHTIVSPIECVKKRLMF